MSFKKVVASEGPVTLSQDENAIKAQIEDLLDSIKKEILSGRDGTVEMIRELGDKAANLHRILSDRGIEVKHHKYMIKNRGMKPNDPSFYKHIHPVEDLLKFLEDQSANNDPEDKTIGHKFDFKVFSRRWGHEDQYSITRTPTGWIVKWLGEIACGRDGRVNREPSTGIFELLDHDSINYPEELPGYVEWLWERAAEDGLSPKDVQDAINCLADWVSLVERNSPTGIFSHYK